MSVMEFRKTGGETEAVSGGAMDRVVVRRKIDKRVLIAGAGGLALLLILLFWLFAPRAGSQSVAADRLSISVVTNGVFEDFLPLRARVTPLVTVYLDAVEGGRVEEMAVEDGADVTKGQLLAVLSNADLQLSTLARQTEVEQQLNNMRSQELALQQTRSANMRDLNQAQTDLAKAERQYNLYKPLAEKGFVSSKQFNDTRDDLNYQRQRLAILKRSISQDEALQASQLAQLRASASSLNSSLGIARSSLSQLNIRAPASGQL
jgi:HlyD family secretion protein